MVTRGHGLFVESSVQDCLVLAVHTRLAHASPSPSMHQMGSRRSSLGTKQMRSRRGRWAETKAFRLVPALPCTPCREEDGALGRGHPRGGLAQAAALAWP